MVNAGVMYRVTGRYMDGQRIIGYHLVGEDGSQAQEVRERIIYLIEKGQIANMRVQTGVDGETIIRGKGINLNKLPVFDEAKQQFRNSSISQEVANSRVNSEAQSKMGQYTIIRRIMHKNVCLGYELKDYSGHITRRKREDVVKLALQKLISNAVASKTVVKETNELRVILRGVGVELRNLPYIIVDDNGKVVNPETSHNMTVRYKFISSNGVLRDNDSGEIKTLHKGDCLICLPTGKIVAVDVKEALQKFKRADGVKSALSDYYIKDERYSVEIFGEASVKITQQLIQDWAILETK